MVFTSMVRGLWPSIKSFADARHNWEIRYMKYSRLNSSSYERMQKLIEKMEVSTARMKDISQSSPESTSEMMVPTTPMITCLLTLALQTRELANLLVSDGNLKSLPKRPRRVAEETPSHSTKDN